MTPRQIELLLDALCGDLGFCLPREAKIRIEQNPGTDVDAFTDAVIRAEGLNPEADISLNLRRDIRAKVLEHFKKAEEDQPLPA
jgi:hypothetical protein